MRKPSSRTVQGVAALLMGVTAAVNAAPEPTVSAGALPRTPHTEPADALKTFHVKPGFHLELAAAEPLVVDPIAMCFDENNRLFVIEMRDYSERRDERLGRIRVLEDENGDGRYEKSSIFADSLAWPTALFYYGGGLFVGCTPDILFLKDNDGDGKADEKKVVYTGIAAGVSRLNVQGLINNFHWGLDNRIHGATGLNGGKVTSSHLPGKTVELRGKDFSFDPRNLADFRPETGGAQHGLSFDSEGHKYVCSNSDHIRLCMYEDRYANRNPFYNMPPASVGIAVDGPAAEVFRISPEEPWRVLRTKWRVGGLVSGPVEGGGRSSGYFTSAAGVTIYRGNAFPEGYVGDAFIADVGSNLIHHKKVRPDDVSFKAERPKDEQKVEFIASTDLWFRPVQFANAPDGTLYVADMYREVIEHPWSIPESIKKHLDLNSGNDRGRIYRIAPDGFKQPTLKALSAASSEDLVALLAHSNGWHRDTAARLLYERQDRTVAGELKAMFTSGKSGLAKLHALQALEGLNAIEAEVLAVALKDEFGHLREHGILLVEKHWQRLSETAQHGLWSTLKKLADDPSARVRYQLAFTLGEIQRAEKPKLYASIIRHDPGDPYLQAAVLSSLKDEAGQVLTELAGEASCQAFIGQLFYQIGARHSAGDLKAASQVLERDLQPETLFAWLRALGDGLNRGGSSLAKSGLDLKPILARADRTAMDSEVKETTRVQAVQLLGTLPFGEAGEKLMSLLSVQQPQSIQLAALQVLKKYSDAAVGSGVVQRWRALSPRVRAEALTVLLERPERALALLQGIGKGEVAQGQLDANQNKFLRQHKDKKVREMAAQVLGPSQNKGRQEVVNTFLSALQLKGDAKAGKQIYEQRCASCHRAGKEGNVVGPDLVTIKNTGREKLLINILDPNREVPANYLAYQVDTKAGDSFLGILVRENNASVTLKQAFEKEETVPRSSIANMKNQGQSLMPEGLEAGLDAQAMANLLEFIETLTQ